MTPRYLTEPRGPRLRTVADDEPWQNLAACRGDESLSWFTKPRMLPPDELERLARTCRDCPVLVQCHVAAHHERAHHVTRAGSWWRYYPARDPTSYGFRPWAGEYLRTGYLPRELFFDNLEETE